MKKSNAQKLREYYAVNPDATPAEVAKRFKVSTNYAYVIRNQVKGAKKDWKTIDIRTSDEPALPITMEEDAPDMVNHPAHYKTGGVETIDFIEAKGLNYRLGNVVKYVTRADHKGDRLENLKKAQWYLEREIAKSAP